jgi:glycosyltransferase involved in cell wall biosynthesis
MIDITIIIPHRHSFGTLLRLLNTIPEVDNIEVIVIDDKSHSTTVKYFKNHKFKDNVKVIFSKIHGGAGKARNTGLDNASGEWVIFADSDDYFSKKFLEITTHFLNNKDDIIYFGTNSITESGDPSYRHLRYMNLIENYLKNETNEKELKFHFLAPWGKMIKRELLEKYKIRFEEVLSGEDVLFSLKTANCARKITASSNVLYIITQTINSLSTTFEKDHFNAKFNATLQGNRFLCSINESRYQQSILYFLGRSYMFGLKYFIYVINQLIKYRSNIFIGSRKVFNFKEVNKRREGKSN